MTEWVDGNVALLQGAYPDAEFRLDSDITWVRIPDYPLTDLWTVATAQVAFRIPTQAAEAPYGFWVHPGLNLAAPGDIDNYTFPAPTPWGNDWGQFSFSPAEPWQPKIPISAGPNLLNFARGIAGRLGEGR